MSGFINVKTAQLAQIQDIGRYGMEHYGVSVNGAVDSYAYLAANYILGNQKNRPVIEVTAFNFSMMSSVDVSVCLTGANAEIWIGDQLVDMWKPVCLKAGETLEIKKISKGLRVYMAIGAEMNVPFQCGSASFDSVAKLGQKLAAGQKIDLENVRDTKEVIAAAPVLEDLPTYGSPWTIRVCDGPDTSIFSEELDTFYTTSYRVSPNSNHIGIRLDGAKLANYSPKEVLSRGISIGTIEITPTGQPIVLHRGRSVTAGYPIIGVVASVDLGLIGQARPGDFVKFERISVSEAAVLYKQKFQMFTELLQVR
jgi:5-oxoprolinase (ATP-hydrolysing) subunit C